MFVHIAPNIGQMVFVTNILESASRKLSGVWVSSELVKSLVCCAIKIANENVVVVSHNIIVKV